MTDVALLAADKLTKRFGGLAAVNEVSVKLYRDHLHAVIGPNGAGKSTLTNLLSGDLQPTSGKILFGGEETAGHTPESISRLGLGRSYQKTNIFLPFTVWDNVRLAAQSRERHAPWNPLHWLQSAAKLAAVHQRCERAIELAGLTHRAQTVAATISHGEQRQLEIAMTLATEPTVLPAALPSLLMNGSTGIAVGMATNIPPHNLDELIEAVIATIDDPDISLDAIVGMIKGPDFPTGGVINGREGIESYMRTGRGIVRVRGRAHTEELKNGMEQIVVTEIPYNVNRAALVAAIPSARSRSAVVSASPTRSPIAAANERSSSVQDRGAPTCS